MLKDCASTFYYDKVTGRPYDFSTMVTMTRAHFETEENCQLYMSEWRETTLPRVLQTDSSTNRHQPDTKNVSETSPVADRRPKRYLLQLQTIELYI